MRNQIIFSLAVIALASAPALADTAYSGADAGHKAPLEGKIDMQVSPTRLNRQAIMKRTPAVGANAGEEPAKKGDDILRASVADIGSAFPDLKSLSPSSDATPAKTATPPPMKQPHVWQMSAYGGYYDQTDQIKGTVPGNQLYKYGGFMGDGVTPVPQGPVPMNAGGHINWSPSWKK